MPQFLRITAVDDPNPITINTAAIISIEATQPLHAILRLSDGQLVITQETREAIERYLRSYGQCVDPVRWIAEMKAAEEKAAGEKHASDMAQVRQIFEAGRRR